MSDFSWVLVKDIIRKAGGPTAVAKAIARRHSTVIEWERVPAEHARSVARLAGLHPSEVRPDIYDRPGGTGEAA
jgi:hypothetical protein